MAERCGSRLAVWMEAMTKSNSFQAAGPRSRKAGVVVADEVERELAAHLALPLLDQRGRRQDQGGADQAAQAQLGEDQAGLDGLAQADLVAQQRPAAEALQDRLGRADLVIEQLHVAHQRQTDQPVETGVGAELGGLAGQGEQRQRGPLPGGRLQERLVLRVEGEAHARLGGRFLGRLGGLILPGDQPEPAGILVLQPDGAV